MSFSVGTMSSATLDTNGRVAIGNVRFMVQDGTYHYVYRRDDGIGIFLGGSGDPGNYYDNTTHWFRSIAGAVFMSLNASGVDLNQSRMLSVRTLPASSITASAANTNVSAKEMVFTIGGASGASLAIHSGGTVWIFNSALSAKAT